MNCNQLTSIVSIYRQNVIKITVKLPCTMAKINFSQDDPNNQPWNRWISLGFTPVTRRLRLWHPIYCPPVSTIRSLGVFSALIGQAERLAEQITRQRIQLREVFCKKVFKLFHLLCNWFNKKWYSNMNCDMWRSHGHVNATIPIHIWISFLLNQLHSKWKTLKTLKKTKNLF